MSGQSHRSDPQVLNRRTLHRDHRRLLEILRPGMSVLDVGCGQGAITSGIAQAVFPGVVVGLDRDPENLSVAREQYRDLPNLTFEDGDILSMTHESQFDLVNAARVLQWMSDPGRGVARMKQAAKPGGRIVALDYNHDDNSWEPGLPSEFSRFYRSFLDWRKSNQWDNRMADHLPELFRSAGIEEIQVRVSDEIAGREHPDFVEIAGVWLYVTRSVGPKMVAAGFVSESERAGAESAYAQWVREGLTRQTLVLRTVEGIVRQ